MTEALPAGHVLVDTENLFFGFGRHHSRERAVRVQAFERRALLFPGVPDDLARCLVPMLVHDLADWIEERWDVRERHHYGKRADPGLDVAVDTLAARGFTPHFVAWGKDVADQALVGELESLVVADPAEVVLGGGDGLVLRAAKRLREEDERRVFFAIIPDTRSHSVDAVHRKYGDGMSFTALDLVRDEQRQRRRSGLAARQEHRARLRAVLEHVRAVDELPPPATAALGTAAVAIARTADLPSPDGLSRAEWAERTSAALRPPLDEATTASLVGWAAIELDEQPRAPGEDDAERLFRAAIAVTVGERVSGEYAALLRQAVRRTAPERLTALERAMAPWIGSEA